jgi:hypothetical protein
MFMRTVFGSAEDDTGGKIPQYGFQLCSGLAYPSRRGGGKMRTFAGSSNPFNNLPMSCNLKGAANHD